MQGAFKVLGMKASSHSIVMCGWNAIIPTSIFVRKALTMSSMKSPSDSFVLGVEPGFSLFSIVFYPT